MKRTLSADRFKPSKKIYEVGFHNILKNIINCCGLLLENNEPLKNNEIFITKILVEKYLNNSIYRETFGIENLIFNREVAEGEGFVDIKVQTASSLNNPKAFYLFECKRLDGSTDLNKKYIAEGIMRFVKGKYSAYYGLNGMIGFEVKKIDTTANVNEINRLLVSHFQETELSQRIPHGPAAFPVFSSLFKSMHRIVPTGELTLFHLMLDISTVVSFENPGKENSECENSECGPRVLGPGRAPADTGAPK